MSKITPEMIDASIEFVDGFEQEQIDASLSDLERRQPSIFAYLTSEEETSLFTPEEKEVMFFLVLVLWTIATKNLKMPQRLGMAKVDAIQDANWKAIEELPQPDKDESLDEFLEPILEDYPEPELLYLILDVLLDDGEEEEEDELMVSDESLVPLFVMLKTMVDCLFLDSNSDEEE